MPDNPLIALSAAIRAANAGAADELLSRHPELGARLNDPMPDDAFGATRRVRQCARYWSVARETKFEGNALPHGP